MLPLLLPWRDSATGATRRACADFVVLLAAAALQREEAEADGASIVFAFGEGGRREGVKETMPSLALTEKNRRK